MTPKPELRRPTPQEAASHLTNLIFKASRTDSWRHFGQFGDDFCNLVKKELKKTKKGEAVLSEMGDLAAFKTNMKDSRA